VGKGRGGLEAERSLVPAAPNSRSRWASSATMAACNDMTIVWRG
jgi:hypothetical protein